MAPRLLRLATVKLPPQIPVAVFLTRFEAGGTERQMIELIRRLDPARFRVHVGCFHREGAWLPRVADRAASLVEFPIAGFPRPSTVAQMLAFTRWCRREQIAVVQTCDLYANIFGLPAAKLAGVPVRIGSRRELNPDKSSGQIFLQRQAYRCATRVVANSEAARTMLEREGLPRSSIAVICNGIEAGLFRSRDTAPATRRVRTILTVANLRPEKAHEVLIDAAALLVPEHPELHFQLAGAGPCRARLESLVRGKGLHANVSLLGHRDDIPALLAGADLFVLPSRSEAFPNSAMEAMAAGLPVVGGLLNLIEDGRTGLLVPPDNPRKLADAIRRLVEDPAFAHHLGDRAREQVAERYSFETMVQAFEELYVAGLAARLPSAAGRRATAAI